MVSSAGAKVASDRNETPIHDKISALRQGKGALRSTAMGALPLRQGSSGTQNQSSSDAPPPPHQVLQKSRAARGKEKGQTVERKESNAVSKKDIDDGHGKHPAVYKSLWKPPSQQEGA